MRKCFVTLLAGLLIGGCGNFEFKSNLHPDNFRKYYKPSQVSEMTYAEVEKYDYHSFGSVSGLSCQINEIDVPATEAAARTEARLKAVDLGANTIVFGKCIKLKNTPACYVSVTCYADAIKTVSKRK